MSERNESHLIAGEGFSIVMPCYNAEATLELAIESVISQSLKSWELIIIDDGSTDGSLEVITRYQKKDSRIRLFQQVNSGPSIARNKGVELANFALIAFLDSDDAWTSDHLHLHKRHLEEHPNMSVSFSACDIMDEKGHLTGESTLIPAKPLSSEDILASNPTTTCSTLVFCKSVFLIAGPFRQDMKYAEDQEWLFRVLHSGLVISPIGKRTVLYRTSQNGLSADIEKMAAGWDHFITLARQLDPVTVQKTYKSALTKMSLYHARRSIRTGQAFSVSAKYISKAILKGKLTSFHQYAQLLVICVAAVFPRLFNSLYSTLKA